MLQTNKTRIYLILLVLVLAACGSQHSMEAHQAKIASKGAAVMPFDLERTTHIFEKQPTGGLQQVISDDGDAAQIQLIRSHLELEAGRFQAGDFQDPAMIHGDNMAGLHTLMTQAEKIDISYSEIENGAQIIYSSDQDDLIAAVHAWFDQQVADHGSHAEGH